MDILITPLQIQSVKGSSTPNYSIWEKLSHLALIAYMLCVKKSKLLLIPSTQLSLVLLMYVNCSVYPSTNSPRNFFQMSLDSSLSPSKLWEMAIAYTGM